MTRSILPPAILFMGLGLTSFDVAQAAVAHNTVSQTATFSDFTGADYQDVTLFAASPTATFAPFNTALGTLDEVNVTWTISASVTGTSTTDTGGQIQLTWGGTEEINGVGYTGDGGGTGASGDAGKTFAADYTRYGNPFTFVIAGYDYNYDPAIYADLTGGAPITATFDSGPMIGSGQSVASGAVTETATVSLDYVYSTGSAPEPAAWALMLVGVGAVGGAVRTRRTRSLLAA